MRRIGQVAVALVLPALLAAEAASAQVVAGIPVYYNPGGGTGLSVAANAGTTSSDFGSAEGKAWALSASVGLSRLRLSATLGQWNPDAAGASNQTTYGGMAEMRLFGGGLVPVAISAGAGVGSNKAKVGTTEYTEVHAPIGLAAQVHFPLFPLTPWVAPRIQIDRVPVTTTSGTGTTTSLQTATSFRVSAGVNFSLLLGLGFHAAVDYGKLPEKIDPGKNTAIIFGVGGHFNFRVPMAM